MRTQAEADRAVIKYADTVRRICFMHLKNYCDVEDVFQEVFLKYILYEHPFDNEEHEKAWIIRVSINACKDMLRSFFRRRVCSIEDIDIAAAGHLTLNDETADVFDAILKLPEKYKDVIFLFYYEGYTAVEIANMMKKRENTIYTWLSRARAKLKDILGGDFFEK